MWGKSITDSMLDGWSREPDPRSADEVFGKYCGYLHTALLNQPYRYRLLPQGSYANRTRVVIGSELRAALEHLGETIHGDVDIVVAIEQPTYWIAGGYAQEVAVYRTWYQLRQYLSSALQAMDPGARVEPRARAIRIVPPGYDVEVDVVVAVRCADRPEALAFWTLPSSGMEEPERILAYPVEHRRQIDQRDAQLDRRFRPVARAMKAATTYARAYPCRYDRRRPPGGIIGKHKSAGLRFTYTAGWQLESLLHNLDRSVFRNSVPDTFDRVVRWLHQLDYPDLCRLDLRPIVGRVDEDPDWQEWRESTLHLLIAELACQRKLL
jgi:hypothetical protein